MKNIKLCIPIWIALFITALFIECDDIYAVMKCQINRFDYAIDNAYDITLVNKKVPGLMKDENNDTIMTEFIGIFAYSENVRLGRWQMYAFDDKKDTKKAKGVKSNVIARSIINDYTSLTQMK